MNSVSSISAGDLNSTDFKNKKTLIMSKRGSGKTIFIKSILETLPRENLTVISPTAKMNECYEGVECELYYDFLANIESIMNKKPSILILDDCLSPTKFKETQTKSVLERLLNTEKLTLIVTSQDPYFPNELLDYFNFILAGNEDFLPNKQKLFKIFSSYTENLTFDSFHALMLNPFKFAMLNKLVNMPLTISHKSHMMLINYDEKINLCVTKRIIENIENNLEHLIIINNQGINNYSENVSHVYKPGTDVLEHILAGGTNVFKSKSLLIIFEYCLKDLFKLNSQSITEILFNGRHYGITFIIVEKLPPSMGPEMRNNFDEILIGRNYNDNSTLQKLWDHYLGMFPTFKILKTTLKNIPENSLLKIRNYDIDNKISYVSYDDIPLDFTKKYSGEYVFNGEPLYKSDTDSDYDSDKEYSLKDVVKELKKLNKKLDIRLLK
jgi:hypothetical protein